MSKIEQLALWVDPHNRRIRLTGTAAPANPKIHGKKVAGKWAFKIGHNDETVLVVPDELVLMNGPV